MANMQVHYVHDGAKLPHLSCVALSSGQEFLTGRNIKIAGTKTVQLQGWIYAPAKQPTANPFTIIG
jgi:hypothetical protein